MRTFLFVLATMFLETVPLVGQSDDAISRKTLTGLTQVFVLVEDIREDAERAGLSAKQIQTDVELRLRQAGISVVDRDTGCPCLYVSIQTLKTQNGAYVYDLDVELVQVVALVRDPSINNLVATWSSGSFGIAPRDKLRSLRDDIRDKVDQFINAFLAVNSTKAKK